MDDLLSRAAWTAARDAHRQDAERELTGVVERRRRGEYHPVEDFLFDYYTLRPGQLTHWWPGTGRLLADAAEEFAGERYHLSDPDGSVRVDLAGFVAKRGATLDWIVRLLRATASRPPVFGCFGLHEWAMIYGLHPDQVRHHRVPLRHDPETIRAIVDAGELRCTHYDAFRFFTPEAAPKNALHLTRADQIERDQPGCLHATMDLYKWAGKLVPLVPPELLLECYRLARDVRVLDMEASPYDLRGWGYRVVPIETVAGKAEYVARQRQFAERGDVLRAKVLAIAEDALSACAQGTARPTSRWRCPDTPGSAAPPRAATTPSGRTDRSTPRS